MKTETKTKPKYNVLQNVAWMIGLAWDTQRVTLLICVASAAAEVAYNLAQLYLAPQVLAKVESGASVTSLLLTIAAFTAALFVLSWLKAYLPEIATPAGLDIRLKIVRLINSKSMTTSYPNVLNPEFTKLRAKASNSCDRNRDATEHIWLTLSALLQNVGGFLIYLSILSGLNGLLLLVMLITCVAGFLVSRRADRWVFAHRDEEHAINLKEFYLENCANSIAMAKDIRIFGLQPWLKEILNSAYNAYLSFKLRCERVQRIGALTEAILATARNGIAYVYLIQLAMREGLGVPEFLLYFTAISSFTSWVMGILEQSATLYKESLDISEVRSFLEYPEPFRFQGGKPIPQAEAYELQMEEVSFRYPGAERDTIHCLNLTIAPGERLAVVGLNGAGKTTLVKLLSGLLDPTGGRVLLNGQDIREFNRQEYYALFSAVFQDFSIPDVTVAENIAQSTENIDTERIWRCLEQAGMQEFVQSLPNGLDTHIGREVYLDGVMFSGGQTQRLMLARALYKNGPVLLLDEPTAALDPLAENDIYQRYHEMTAGKTAVFISHRLASTRFCDRILFLADGAIAEEGTHESLLAKGGEYAKLFEIQSRYYQEGKEF